MCRALALALLLSSAVVVQGAGQDSVLARLRWRAESLAVEWRRATAIADVVDSVERERAGAQSDTIIVGAVRIITNTSPLPLRAAAERAWLVLDSLYGSAAADLLQAPLLIRAVDPDTAVRRSVLHVGIAVPWNLDVPATTTMLLMTAPLAPPDRGLAQWLGSPLRPSVHPEADRMRVYLQFVTAPSQPVRQCFLGDLARCADALELRPGDDLERWYPTAAERRALARTSFKDLERGPMARVLRTCLAGQDAACTEFLRSLPAGTLPKPLAQDARGTFLRFALREGGRDAYRRLLREPTAPMADRVAAASALPIDSLIARWRRDVLNARPSSVRLSAAALLGAFGWLVFFVGCSVRSSRWRL